jgi:hypothetical protein
MKKIILTLSIIVFACTVGYSTGLNPDGGYVILHGPNNTYLSVPYFTQYNEVSFDGINPWTGTFIMSADCYTTYCNSSETDASASVVLYNKDNSPIWASACWSPGNPANECGRIWGTVKYWTGSAFWDICSAYVSVTSTKTGQTWARSTLTW